MSNEEQFTQCLNSLAACLEDSDNVVEDSIPDDLLLFVRQSGIDPTIRDQFGQSTLAWEALARCYKIGYAKLAEPNASNIHRTLNGAIMLGRNLVSLTKAESYAWSSGAPTEILAIISRILESDSQTPGGTKILNTSLQFLANLANQASSDIAVITKIFDGLVLGTSDPTLTKLLDRLKPEAAAPLLLIIDSCLRNSDVNCLKFYETENGQTLFKYILEYTAHWFALANDVFISFVSQIIHHIIAFGYAPQFLQHALESDDYTPTQLLSFLKLIDAGLADVSPFEFTARKDLFDVIYTLFEETSKKAVPYMISCKENESLSKEDSTPIFHTWNLLIITLDLFEALLSDRIADANEGTNQAIVQYALTQKSIVKTLVELLHVAQKHLPKANKLSEYMEANDSTESYEDQHKKFPLVKGKIICLLGILTLGNRNVQDEIRQLQGLELVLSNCIIDINNPFIKERSIVCLRYLLENNKENQDIVAKLEAKSTVTEEALDEAGLETEIVDGKIALKKKSKIEEL